MEECASWIQARNQLSGTFMSSLTLGVKASETSLMQLAASRRLLLLFMKQPSIAGALPTINYFCAQISLSPPHILTSSTSSIYCPKTMSAGSGLMPSASIKRTMKRRARRSAAWDPIMLTAKDAMFSSMVSVKDTISGAVVGAKANTLIGLSMVEFYGNHAAHMSWAPLLTGHSLMLKKLNLTRPMHREAEVLGVSKRGYLRIESTVLHGWFKLGAPIFIASNEVFAEITNETKQGSGIVALGISCCSQGGTKYKIGAAQVPLLRFTDLQREALQFPLWMIVVGHTTDLAEKAEIITMVCLGKDKYRGGGRDRLVLHKIGFVIFPAELANTLISLCGCRRKCVLGGFGRLLNDYVFSI